MSDFGYWCASTNSEGSTELTISEEVYDDLLQKLRDDISSRSTLRDKWRSDTSLDIQMYAEYIIVNDTLATQIHELAEAVDYALRKEQEEKS